MNETWDHPLVTVGKSGVKSRRMEKIITEFIPMMASCGTICILGTRYSRVLEKVVIECSESPEANQKGYADKNPNSEHG